MFLIFFLFVFVFQNTNISILKQFIDKITGRREDSDAISFHSMARQLCARGYDITHQLPEFGEE